MTHDESALAHQLAALSSQSASLGARLLEAAKAMQKSGALPPEELIAELTAVRAGFDTLRDQSLVLAAAVHLAAIPAPDELQSLPDLEGLLKSIAEAEYKKRGAEKVREGALRVLRDVVCLASRDGSRFAPLEAAQAQARTLLTEIADADWRRLPPEAETLAKGLHAYSELITLVGENQALDDETWARLLKTVGQSFDRALALAAGRGKLHLPDAEMSQENAMVPAASPPPAPPAKKDKPDATGFRFETIPLP